MKKFQELHGPENWSQKVVCMRLHQILTCLVRRWPFWAITMLLSKRAFTNYAKLFYSHHISFSNGITVDSLYRHRYKKDTKSKTDIYNWSLLSYTPFLTPYKTASLLLLDRHLEWAPKVCILKKVHCLGKNLMMVKQLQSLTQIQNINGLLRVMYHWVEEFFDCL